MDQFLELDAEVYQSKDQVCRDTLLSRLNRNPHTDIILTTNQTLIGYISLCPIDEQTFSSILYYQPTEEEIEDAVIPYTKPGEYVAYLSSIVIDKKKFPRVTSKWLISSLENHLLKLRMRGIYITKIVAKAVSVAGRKTLLRMKFSVLKDNVFILNTGKRKISFSSVCHTYPLLPLHNQLAFKSIYWGFV